MQGSSDLPALEATAVGMQEHTAGNYELGYPRTDTHGGVFGGEAHTGPGEAAGGTAAVVGDVEEFLARESAAREWIAQVLPEHSESLLSGRPLEELLANGVVLCGLVSYIFPNSVPFVHGEEELTGLAPERRHLAVKENFIFFLEACQESAMIAPGKASSSLRRLPSLLSGIAHIGYKDHLGRLKALSREQRGSEEVRGLLSLSVRSR